MTPQRVWDFGPGCKGFWVEAPKRTGQAPVVFRCRDVPGVPADARGWMVLAFYMHMHTYIYIYIRCIYSISTHILYTYGVYTYGAYIYIYTYIYIRCIYIRMAFSHALAPGAGGFQPLSLTVSYCVSCIQYIHIHIHWCIYIHRVRRPDRLLDNHIC